MDELEQWRTDMAGSDYIAVDNFFAIEFLRLLGFAYEDAELIETRIMDDSERAVRAYPGFRLGELRVYILNTREDGVVYTATERIPAGNWIAERRQS